MVALDIVNATVDTYSQYSILLSLGWVSGERKWEWDRGVGVGKEWEM